MQTLAVLCLQRPLTATYVLKIPRLVISVVKATKQWHSDTSKTEDTGHLAPGEAIGLLTALLLAAETLPRSPSDSTADSLSESLVRALSQLKAEVFSAFAAIGKRKDGQGQGQGQRPPLDSSSSREELNQKKRHTTFLAPKGLIPSLRLITSESGGASSLRSSVVMKGGGGGGAGSVSAVRALQEWAADVLSPPTDIEVKVGLIWPAFAPVQLPETYEEVNDSGEKPLKHSGEERPKNSIEEHVEAVNDQKIPSDPEEEDEGSVDKAEGRAVEKEKEGEEEEEGGGNVEELRRLVKALQAILQGFSTSKID